MRELKDVTEIAYSVARIPMGEFMTLLDLPPNFGIISIRVDFDKNVVVLTGRKH